MSAMELCEGLCDAGFDALDSVALYIAQRGQMQEEANMRLIDSYNDLVNRYNRLLRDYRGLHREYEAVHRKSDRLRIALEECEERRDEAWARNRQQAEELVQVQTRCKEESDRRRRAEARVEAWQQQAEILLNAAATFKTQLEGVSISVLAPSHRRAVDSSASVPPLGQAAACKKIDPLQYLVCVEPQAAVVLQQ